MKIMMTKTAAGISREDGAETMRYQAGTEYEATEEWKKKVLQGFVKMGMANEIGGNAGPNETKRARNTKGQLVADDPSTPDVNEAWEGGKRPAKRGRPKKTK